MALRGIQTLIFPAPDLREATTWWTSFLGREPYFNQPFYVGFNLEGYQIGLNPGASMDAGPVTYIGVDDIDDAVRDAFSKGAQMESPAEDVGDGIKVATILSPTNHRFDLIFNPHFVAE